jgi:hypothetical protein
MDRLEENGLRYAVLPLQNGVTIIISERGGRVFGPFLEPAGESIYWVSGAFARPDTFASFWTPAIGTWAAIESGSRLRSNTSSTAAPSRRRVSLSRPKWILASTG